MSPEIIVMVGLDRTLHAVPPEPAAVRQPKDPFTTKAHA